MVIENITIGQRGERLAGISTKVDNASSMTLGQDSMLGQADMLGWDMKTRSLENFEGLVHQGKNEVTKINSSTGEREVMNGVVVGSNFVPIQLEHAFSIGDFLIQLGATPRSAGVLNNGRLVFATLDLHKEIMVGGIDKLTSEFILVMGNDGSSSLKGIANMTRLYCTNQIPAQTRNSKNRSLSIRHTASNNIRISQAKEIIQNANNSIDEFGVVAEKLVNVPMQNDQFLELATNIYPKPTVTEDAPNTRSVSRWSNMIEELESIFLGDGSAGDTTGQVGNTAWCGYNALTERIDWYRSSKSTDNSSLRSAQALGVVGQTGKNKTNILSQVEQFVDDNAKQLYAV